LTFVSQSSPYSQDQTEVAIVEPPIGVVAGHEHGLAHSQVATLDPGREPSPKPPVEPDGSATVLSAVGGDQEAIALLVIEEASQVLLVVAIPALTLRRIGAGEEGLEFSGSRYSQIPFLEKEVEVVRPQRKDPFVPLKEKIACPGSPSAQDSVQLFLIADGFGYRE
jgi:hypothetical protein